MNFKSMLGGMIQTTHGSEGGRLIAAGFLRPINVRGHAVGVQPSLQLTALFAAMPPIERLYPLLVEYLACLRVPEWSVRAVEVRGELQALGMSEEGIAEVRMAAKA